MSSPLNTQALDQLFFEARTFNGWQDKPVSEATLRQLAEALKMAPTAANSSPARFHFVLSKEAKEKLKPHLAPGNVEKTMQAPVTAIVAYDTAFYEALPKLFPHTDARSWYVGNEPLIQETAFRNGSLQGAYLIMAARALGLDCGPMSGFDTAGVDATFFAGTTLKSNFLVNLGYGDKSSLFPRSPRFTFEEFCAIL